MTVYIGVDFHSYEQTVAYCDERGGEVRYRQFLHSDKQSLKAFYRKFGDEAVVGVEATGCTWWFEKLLFENRAKLQIDDPRLIRRAALSRHKHDFRDAETILDLLVNDQFPRITPRSEQRREMLWMLDHRHFLVKKRTSIANTMQAFARSEGLDKFRLQTLKRQKELVDSVSTDMEQLIVGSRLSLYNELSREIAGFDVKLAEEAERDVRTKLLMTHPGVGVVTALALTHTLGDVRRFRRKEEVVAFVGLDPLEKSSGEKRRIGSISKHGSRLMRNLLGQAAQACRDPRIKAHYLQVSRRRGRPKAKVAAARKLLINCYVMLRDDISYEQFAIGGAKLACARGQER
ncbi:MAG TPA: IS110 family transposase [Pyrinomonadaceae bacterium]|nr:IS110 family transposase [Pyrinomonadaceae bacterium]HMP67013.1 IS110 family transposase [Pyrinomonadaceae bacterium]